ncbi:MAG: ABC transporter ATP-binding protein [Hydrogenibacillus sp.]|nr:ABC transporter ATP-binding protein [Hydrogenibacillus sp.]
MHFRAMPGEIVTVLGPNGIGKTTLFKALLGFLPPRAGRMRWNGEDLLRLPRRALARLIGYVPQLSAPVFPFTALGGRGIDAGGLLRKEESDCLVRLKSMTR